MEKEQLIQKWLNDTLSEQELESFKQLNDYAEITGIVENAGYFKASRVSTVDDFDTFAARYEKESGKVKKINWVRPFMRIASVLVVGALLSYFFLANKNIEISTLAGEKTTITLPDSSTVVVNALTEISYSKNKWASKREVQLKGEAFFKVAKGATFDVVTPAGVVRVVGTQFNVRQRADFFEVECFEGIVQVMGTNVNQRLEAGDRYRLANGESMLGKTAYQNPQWVKNVSSFERVALAEVIAELERQYNIKVTGENIGASTLFTGGFVHDNLSNALQSITEPLGLKYRIVSTAEVQIYR